MMKMRLISLGNLMSKQCKKYISLQYYISLGNDLATWIKSTLQEHYKTILISNLKTIIICNLKECKFAALK